MVVISSRSGWLLELLTELTRDLSIPKCPLRGRKIELADFLEEGEDGVEEVVVSILQEYSANLA